MKLSMPIEQGITKKVINKERIKCKSKYTNWATKVMKGKKIENIIEESNTKTLKKMTKYDMSERKQEKMKREK